MRSLVFFALLLMPTIMMAQDDDLYFVPEKPVKQSERTVRQYAEPGEVENLTSEEVVYGNSKRDEDEYNRMYSYSGSSQNAGGADYADSDTLDADMYDDSEDFEYSRRIVRFRSPRIGLALSSPFYWDLVYSYGAYDYLYDSYYYDPFFWGYGWNYGWAWGPWDSWYGPIWGWYHVHHCHYWGCGPMWVGNYYPSYRQQNRGTFNNRIGRGDRIRTSALASSGRSSFGEIGSGRSSALSRGNTLLSQNRVGRGTRNSTRSSSESSYSRYQRTRTSEATRFNERNTNEQRSSNYNRPSSTRTTSTRNSTVNRTNSSRTNTRTSESNAVRNRNSNTNSSRSSYSSGSNRSSYSSGSSRSSFSSGSSGVSRGGGFSGGGGSRGGRR